MSSTKREIRKVEMEIAQDLQRESAQDEVPLQIEKRIQNPAQTKAHRSCQSIASSPKPKQSAFRQFSSKCKQIFSKIYECCANAGESMAEYVRRVFTLPLLRGDPISFVRPEDFNAAGDPIQNENEKEYEQTMDMLEAACNYTDNTRKVLQNIIANRKEFAAKKKKYAKNLDSTKLAPWTESFIGHLESTFQVFDSSGDAVVDFDELSIILTDYGDKTTPEERTKVFESADPAGKGALTFNEFALMFHSITQSPDSYPSTIVESFRSIERNMARIRGLDVVQQLQAGLF